MGFKETFAEMTELSAARFRPLTVDEQARVRGIVAACFAAHTSGRLLELSDAVLRHGEREIAVLRRMESAGKN